MFRALVGWGVVSFAVLQVAEPLMHALDLPDWTLKAVVGVLALGFPVTSALAWIFDLKTTGIERTPSTPPAGAGRPPGLAGARLVLVLLGVGLAAATPGVAFYLLRRPPADQVELPEGQRIPVAVADFENDTGEPELDALSGLLITSLEQSRRLDVLTRSRMVDILRQMGHASIPRIDEALGREVGRKADVRALVLAAIHRFDTLYTIEVKALDPATSTYLFTLKEDGKGKSSVPGMIDRLSARTRERLRERPADVASSSLKVADAITPSVDAYQHYFMGMNVARMRGDYAGAVREFQKALAIDPGFALASYQIAYLGVWTDLPQAERMAALDAALRSVGRMPAKERSLVLAWKAHLDGREEEADAIYQRAALAYPREKDIQYLAGDLRYHEFLSPRGSARDLSDVLPFFEAAVALDPSDDEAQNHLVACLGLLGRYGAALEAARAWVKAAPSAAAYESLGAALAMSGQMDEAVDAYRRAVDMGLGAIYAHSYPKSLAWAGRFAEAEKVLADVPPDLFPSARLGAVGAQVEVNLLQGRYRRALSALDGVPDQVALADRSGTPPRMRAAIHAASGRPGEAWAAMRPIVESGGGVDLVPMDLALAGDAAHAAEAAKLLVPGSRQLKLYEAVAAWRSGRTDEAASRLQAIVAGKYAPDRRLASGLLGELELERGRDGAAIEALERSRTSPMLQRPSAEIAIQFPRTLLLLAQAYERTGDPVRARERLEELLTMWKGADPDLPVTREAKALQARLKQAPTERASR
ncbi:MAG TPA: tetratricopeptide repeat protein [Anaeromyxobacteraceae bacterium]|nr:tetratricopeptide repeat protein [Anaeromyxobacteraceae bacterium]